MSGLVLTTAAGILLALLAVAGGGAGAFLESASPPSVGTAAAGPSGGAGTGGEGFVSPLPGAPVSQGYGCTALAIEPPSRLCAGGHFHSGVDLAAPAGTPVRATLAGVAHVVVSSTGYGLHLIVDHGQGLTSLYGHLSAVAVADGEAVGRGEVIGAVGSTGNSTGPHLHFEIRRDGLPEDPGLDLEPGG
jgi:murein DD-endopeptidase MepM/ murein hydrolase activator NlpD